jgi:hypothetical protein
MKYHVTLKTIPSANSDNGGEVHQLVNNFRYWRPYQPWYCRDDDGMVVMMKETMKKMSQVGVL